MGMSQKVYVYRVKEARYTRNIKYSNGQRGVENSMVPFTLIVQQSTNRRSHYKAAEVVSGTEETAPLGAAKVVFETRPS